MKDKINKIEKLFEKTGEELRKIKEEINALSSALHKPEESLIPTDAVFKDGHREKIVYLKPICKNAYEFATESGMYSCCEHTPEYVKEYRGIVISSPHLVNFYKLKPIVEDGYIVVKAFSTDITHIEFEIGGGNK